MKKVIPFTKQLPFNRNIAEVTDISVSHDLKLKDLYEIEGNIILDGKYKMTTASQIEEEFHYDLPFVIAIDSKYDTSNLEISISDFNFEIINEEDLKVNVDITLNNLVDKLDIDSIRNKYDNEEDILNESDNYNEIDIPLVKEEKKEEIKEETTTNELNSIFNNSDNKEYSTYYVYIYRDGDTIEYLLDKYNISKEDLENYNDLSSITIGSKIIIPCSNE